jgi:hypothetical protein
LFLRSLIFFLMSFLLPCPNLDVICDVSNFQTFRNGSSGSLEQRSSWGSDSLSPDQNISRLLWNS